MSDTLTITLPDGAAFGARCDETLLAAAQRAHWLVRYGCRNGNCEACAATLLRGRVIENDRIIDANANNANQSTILLCLCRAESDLEIALPGTPQHGSEGQAQRRYARLIEYVETDEHTWRMRFALPAGRQPVAYPGQYVAIESEKCNLARAYIDNAASSVRELCAISVTRLPIASGDYVHLRYPLGYCYLAQATADTAILFEPGYRIQAAQLQSAYQAQHNRAPALFEIVDDAPPTLDTKLNTTIFACAGLDSARRWFDALLASGAEFAEFRCDDAIWRRWRVQRQDDNNNRFVVATGLSENAARALARDMESRGHKQLYWAEPLL